jgi:signal transduction histidine kinase
MARGEPLPAAAPGTRRTVSEVGALQTALRSAATQITSAQARALETERVRAWGEMARRIAHEMKNPLTPLRLAVHRLARSGAPDLDEPLEVITEEIARLDELAKQFGLLGRPSSGPRSDIDVRELVAELLASDIPPSIETTLECDDVPLVHAHYDALQRAVRNLLRNAVEAIHTAGGNGRIDVAIRRIPGDAISISIRDNGGGIPPEQLERIFDPDYTLKAGGTGLGLALVRQAVAAHEGTVTARNEDGGAVFDIHLPVSLSS